MTKDIETTKDDIRDTYHERRAIESGESYSATVLGVEPFDSRRLSVYQNRTNGVLPTDKYILSVYLDIAGNIWKAKATKTDIHQLQKQVSNNTSNLVSLVNLCGEELEVEFGDNMDMLRVGETEISLEKCTERTVSELPDESVDISLLSDMERDITLREAYRTSRTDSEGWRCTVTSVEPADEDSICVTVSTQTRHDLSWTFALPETVTDENEKSELIETVGHGDPFFLEGEQVTVVHRKDADGSLDRVARSGNWLLVTPSAYAEWVQQSDSSQSSTTSGSTSNLNMGSLFIKIGALASFSMFFYPIMSAITASFEGTEIEMVSESAQVMQLLPIVVFCLFTILVVLGEIAE